MAKVISIKSWKELGQQNYTENVALVEQKGRYLGNLPYSEADVVRQWQNTLAIKKEQIDELIEDFQESYDQYSEYITDIFLYLKMSEPFSPELERLFINENDGHIWAVKHDGGASNNRTRTV